MSRSVTDTQHEPAEPAATRSEGRRGGRARSDRGPRLPEQAPFRQPTMRLNHTEVLSADEVEAIHEASLTILERIGMEFLDGESRSICLLYTSPSPRD